ncbi:hypothetical protein [Sporosarcina sp. G11-34]|uniref:hypothetical protein n=1 Tax=Sporosarcina sp. G11-34 TaxID=2849605 RepID=UPI0022A93E45|nr:hypothetical protein [Sporosarcina sp. G11-34]MCZ2257210.1 hypothetical protein [Sporosarcina sp. G11-34]
MSLPVPLMFVSGPPIFIAVPFIEEESTSIFVIDVDEQKEIAEGLPVEINETKPAIIAKLNRIQTSFGQQIYRPLTFHLDEDERITGNVSKFEGNTIVVEIDGDEDTIVSIDLSEIQDVKWRGKSLPEN